MLLVLILALCKSCNIARATSVGLINVAIGCWSAVGYLAVSKATRVSVKGLVLRISWCSHSVAGAEINHPEAAILCGKIIVSPGRMNISFSCSLDAVLLDVRGNCQG